MTNTEIELGAGTGRLTFPFLERGYEVVASDLSADMLVILDQRLAESEAAGFADRCTTVVADMTDFRLDRKFGIIVIGGSAVTEQQRCLPIASVNDAREHLRRNHQRMSGCSSCPGQHQL